MKEKIPEANPKESPEEVMEREVWAAEMGETPDIDLHGLSKTLALSELESFLHQEMMHGTRVIKIIHGRGNGVLRKAVNNWLKQQKDLVLYFRDATAPQQKGGVTFALLEKVK